MTSNYPPDYEGMKHLIDDPIEDDIDVDLVGDFDDSDEFRENNPHLFPDRNDDIPLIPEME